ncbi:hypothetical protein Aple_093010 [Acrocarpospora pleiomorpha]|uniref:Uncharacterized protein n=1 Tax=Acrocarpospora pleiomorpha TaxID=90975 RepID=A0A5M3XZC2_9ACTN|nr:hypothetical protein Aple_093010 [Acrocarpospora pleiomorpha]
MSSRGRRGKRIARPAPGLRKLNANPLINLREHNGPCLATYTAKSPAVISGPALWIEPPLWTAIREG